MDSSVSTRAVAMVSGGMDSLVSLAMARSALDVRLILFFDYGQRARDGERVSVVNIASYYGIPLQEVGLPWLASLLPAGMRAGATGDEPLTDLDEVWIPNRNGVFVNIAAAYAESYGCDMVVTGFNRDEAAEFPDNGREYVDHANAALGLSTRNRVTVKSFTLDMGKREILLEGMEAGAPLSAMWSCYRSGPKMCGRCASCRRLRIALDAVPVDRRPIIEFEGES